MALRTNVTGLAIPGSVASQFAGLWKSVAVVVLSAVPASAHQLDQQDLAPVEFPPIAVSAAKVDGFVPRGWIVDGQAIGDLNGDDREDVALILKMDNPANRIAPPWNPEASYDTNPRMLVVVFARRSGGYARAAVDHRLIPRLSNPNQDDPFDEVVITAGTLRVKMHLFMSAGGWAASGSSYTLRWQDDAFKLIGFERDTVARNTGETTEVSLNYLTGRKELKAGNIGSNQQQSRVVHVGKKRLLRLSEIGDGLMFDPDKE
jgi:hypothetical protein